MKLRLLISGAEQYTLLATEKRFSASCRQCSGMVRAISVSGYIPLI